MELGKVTENILDRSVFKKLHIDKSGNCGVDSVSVNVEGNVAIATATSDFCESKAGQLAVTKAVNNLLASGAIPKGVSVNVTLSPRMREIKLKSIMEQVDETCLCFNIPVLAGHTCVSDGVTRAIVSATAIGHAKAGGIASAAMPKVGMEIVATKFIGVAGTALLAEKYREELISKLPGSLVDRAVSFADLVSIEKEARALCKFDNIYCHDISEGGIFQALWEIGSFGHTGFEVDIKRIPVKQETIEICEFFGINPYELDGTGGMLIATDQADLVCQRLGAEGIDARVIGRFTDNNDKIIINGEERRFLDSSRVDAIYKVFQEEL